ncbi:phage major capsid protein, P2 family [Stenotrophomonas maltophilia]|uniref:phage major capsid protein, P2 family n=1 Tax=Stenotrophomonas maltophilia TaxID=40324 RepID=UPI0015DD8FFD|nr:phage major capsid protein, P2 family [Stenotrophomonas maltophilia]MBA0415581.1 phage major capsid protein, P2 family [Stenotrophomonas maltophilia]
MRTETRTQFNQFTRRVAELNNIESAALSFSVEPSVQQTIEQRIQESSAFLSAINMPGVIDLKGEKIGVGVSGTIAGRTDTSGDGKREPADVTALDKTGYECVQTNYDTAIPYARLDAWARQKNFQTLLRDAIIQRQALDRIMVGFNGTSAAATTSRATNPLLQDVNKGWLQKYREHAAKRVMNKGKAGGNVLIGGDKATRDYANLDALVMDLVSNLIDPWHQQDPALVVVLGRNLVHDKYFPIINQDNKPTEQLAADLVLGTKRIGGLQPVVVPFTPADALLVTSLDNLSLYWQIDGRRRYIKEEPEKNRIANFESSNDCYVVEDYGRGAVVENIKVVEQDEAPQVGG